MGLRDPIDGNYMRSPPLGSLADEILCTGTGLSSNQNYYKAKSILSNLKEMTERFSDFASCESGVSETESEASKDDHDGFKIHERKKKGRKHRLSPSPDKDFFMKKANMASSPEYYE